MNNRGSDCRLSIIIPAKFSAEVIRRCLDSFDEQRNIQSSDYEIIVVVPTLEDPTVEVFKDYTHLPLFAYAQIGKGIYGAMNTGILRSQGQAILFMGADDAFFGPEALSFLVHKIQQTDFFDILQFRIQHILDWKPERSISIPIVHASKRFFYRENLPHQGLVYNRELFKSLQYDETYSVYADWAFNLSLFLNGKMFCPVDRIITRFNSTGISQSPSSLSLRAIERSRIHSTYFTWPERAYYLSRLKLSKLWWRLREKIIHFVS